MYVEFKADQKSLWFSPVSVLYFIGRLLASLKQARNKWDESLILKGAFIRKVELPQKVNIKQNQCQYKSSLRSLLICFYGVDISASCYHREADTTKLLLSLFLVLQLWNKVLLRCSKLLPVFLPSWISKKTDR